MKRFYIQFNHVFMLTSYRQLGTNRRLESLTEDMPEERRWVTQPQSSLKTFSLLLFFTPQPFFLICKN